MMPTAWGNGPTLSGYCRRWRSHGLWARLRDTLRPWARPCGGRLAEPSAGGVERQRIKTATQGTDVGCAGNKTITGRKRHLLRATLGLIVAVVVTAANIDARPGWVALRKASCARGVKRLRQRWVDGGYAAPGLRDWVRGWTQPHKIDLEVVEHTGQGVVGIKQRWKVERTLAWVRNDRRHSRDYDGLTVHSEAMLQISMIRLLLKRLV